MKTVLLTGASGKIGEQILKGLLSDGCKVLAQVRSFESAERLKKDYETFAQKRQLLVWQGSFLEKQALEEFVTWANTVSPPDFLIYSARSLDSLNSEDHFVSQEDFSAEWHLQVWTPFALIHALRHTLKRVVLMSSIYSEKVPYLPIYKDPSKVPLNYGVTKAAMNQLVRELAVRFAETMSVNAIGYGGVLGRADKDFLKAYTQRVPKGRMLAPTQEELYPPVRFFLLDDSGMTTGQTLFVDGGYGLW